MPVKCRCGISTVHYVTASQRSRARFSPCLNLPKWNFSALNWTHWEIVLLEVNPEHPQCNLPWRWMKENRGGNMKENTHSRARAADQTAPIPKGVGRWVTIFSQLTLTDQLTRRRELTSSDQPVTSVSGEGRCRELEEVRCQLSRWSRGCFLVAFCLKGWRLPSDVDVRWAGYQNIYKNTCWYWHKRFAPPWRRLKGFLNRKNAFSTSFLLGEPETYRNTAPASRAFGFTPTGVGHLCFQC